MLGHFVRVSESVGNSELFGRFVCGFLAARADRRDLELTKRAQGRNVGIATPAVAHTCSNDADTDFFCCHDVFFHSFVLLNKPLPPVFSTSLTDSAPSASCRPATTTFAACSTRLVIVSKEYLVSIRDLCDTKWNQGN